MSNNPKKNRDAGSGKYVSQDYADQHKDTTVSETGRHGPDVSKLLDMLVENGGAIVRVFDLDDNDIEEAKQAGRISGEFAYQPIEE
jgi:hypothetical protein